MKIKVYFLVLVLVLSLSLVVALRNSELYSCKSECAINFKLKVQECNSDYKECRLECSNSECKRNCVNEKNICKKEAREEHKACKSTCTLGNFSLSRESCELGRGSYQQLCNGNYFDLRCSTEYYCVCGGDLNLSCPLNHTCIREFKVKNIPTIDVSWKNPSGTPIGDIGICKKN